MEYEHRKHDGSLPVIGVNTFINPDPKPRNTAMRLSRSTEQEKRSQIKRLREFKATHRDSSVAALQGVRQAAIDNQNIFEQLMNAVRAPARSGKYPKPCTKSAGSIAETCNPRGKIEHKEHRRSRRRHYG